MCLSKRDYPLNVRAEACMAIGCRALGEFEGGPFAQARGTATRPLLDNMVARFDRDMIPCEDGPDEVRK